MDVPELITAALNNELPAQEQLFNRYYDRTMRLCLKNVKDCNEAKELVFMTYSSLFETLHKFRYSGKGSLFKWIAGIVFIKMKEYNRTRFRWTMIEEDMVIDPHAESSITARMDHGNLVEFIYRQKDNVYVLVFIMKELLEMDHRQISKKLNMPISTSRKYLTRGKKYLYKLLLNQQYIQHEK